MLQSKNFLIFLILTVELLLQVFAIKWLALHQISSLSWKYSSHCPKNRKYRKLFGLSALQAKMCRQNIELMPHIIDASESAISACQKAFAGHRWNCSSIQTAPFLTPDLTKNTKEQAFVYALTAAAISQRIAKACVSGELPNCSCGFGDTSAKTTLVNSNFNNVMNNEIAETYKWKGCSDNVIYGNRISREWTESSITPRKSLSTKTTFPSSYYNIDTNSIMNFSNKFEYSVQKRFALKRRNIISKDITIYKDDEIQKYFIDSELSTIDKGPIIGSKAKLNQHNNEVGRHVTEQSLYRKCKCHGVSSSCDVKTCWYTLSPLDYIAERLKERYVTAKMIGHNSNQFEDTPKVDVRKLRALSIKHSLVYLRRSPNYCERNLSLGSFGTQMRECNLTSTGPDSCESLCCGRGFNTQLSRVEKQCHCKYIHCCYVKCKTCVYEFDKHYCK